MNYQSHIKSTYLKSLVQAPDTSCQQKLNSIEKLLGLPLSDSVDNEETPKNEVGVNEENVNNDAILDKRLQAHEKILEGLSGKTEKLAKGLLQRIESVDNLSYDYDSLEISINSEVKRYSSIRSLIHRTVQVASPNLPLHFVQFINALLINKTSINFLLNSDALNIRQSLIEIHKAKRVALGGDSEVNGTDGSPGVQNSANVAEGEVGQQNVDDVIKDEEIEGGNKINEESLNETKKRKRDDEDDDEDEVRDGKRKKTVSFDVSDDESKVDDVSKAGKRKRKREEKDDDDLSVAKKKKSTKKEKKPVKVGERRSQRLELKSNLKKDWLSDN